MLHNPPSFVLTLKMLDGIVDKLALDKIVCVFSFQYHIFAISPLINLNYLLFLLLSLVLFAFPDAAFNEVQLLPRCGNYLHSGDILPFKITPFSEVASQWVWEIEITLFLSTVILLFLFFLVGWVTHDWDKRYLYVYSRYWSGIYTI